MSRVTGSRRKTLSYLSCDRCCSSQFPPESLNEDIILSSHCYFTTHNRRLIQAWRIGYAYISSRDTASEQPPITLLGIYALSLTTWKESRTRIFQSQFAGSESTLHKRGPYLHILHELSEHHTIHGHGCGCCWLLRRKLLWKCDATWKCQDKGLVTAFDENVMWCTRI
jgi:hypothetical protein